MNVIEDFLVDYLWVVYPMLKDVHSLARLGVLLMNISNSGVTIQNGAESYLVVEVKQKKESDPILIELKGAVLN